MLFNSYTFLFAFLPVALAGYFLCCALGRRFGTPGDTTCADTTCADTTSGDTTSGDTTCGDTTWGAAWLAACSLLFYGWWDTRYLPLLLGSIAFNYATGSFIARRVGTAMAKRALVLGVAGNLALLGYFKYADFFVASVNALGGEWTLPQVLLPIGISFFTFTQIAFLADAAAGKVTEYRLVHYLLFVTYFPHLVAGPVLHHKEMMPQFEDPANTRPLASNFAVGTTIFAIGLAKKVLLADTLAAHASPVFAADAMAPTLLAAWGGALAYTFQLYFDFSGYSDMAIGLSRLFGVRLPLNFASPYQAHNISEFWRRWHMTLSRFLRDYLYIPLGGNRHGEGRRHLNLGITMVLGGLWHGAGWTFVVWGALHGAYLVVHQLWRHWRGPAIASLWRTRGSVALTFLVVVVGWVYFRAPDMETAHRVLAGMLGWHGVALPGPVLLATGSLGTALQGWGVAAAGGGADFVALWLSVAVAAAIAFLAPNTQELVAEGRWQPSPRWALWTGVLLALGLLALGQPTEFLYFQF